MLLYISFFPQLIAGPIVKYRDIAAQITGRKETIRKFAAGIMRFCWGTWEKVLLAKFLCPCGGIEIFNMSICGIQEGSVGWAQFLYMMQYLLLIFQDIPIWPLVLENVRI
mgnify:CR=1 FL=1